MFSKPQRLCELQGGGTLKSVGEILWRAGVLGPDVSEYRWKRSKESARLQGLYCTRDKVIGNHLLLLCVQFGLAKMHSEFTLSLT